MSMIALNVLIILLYSVIVRGILFQNTMIKTAYKYSSGWHPELEVQTNGYIDGNKFRAMIDSAF